MKARYITLRVMRLNCLTNEINENIWMNIKFVSLKFSVVISSDKLESMNVHNKSKNVFL